MAREYRGDLAGLLRPWTHWISSLSDPDELDERPTAVAAEEALPALLDAMSEAAGAHVPDELSRCACDQREVRNVARDERGRCDERPAADRAQRGTAEDRGVRSDPRSAPKERSAHGPVVWPFEPPVRRNRCGIEIVCRRAVWSEEDAVLHLDAAIERDAVLDLHSVADAHPRIDEHVLADVAVRADRGAGENDDVAPDARPVTNPVRLDELARCRMDEDTVGDHATNAPVIEPW